MKVDEGWDVPENAIDSLRNVIVFSSRDWSLSSEDAWIYGVVVGWDEPALKELAEKHGWSAENVERLGRLHRSVLEFSASRQ